MSKLSELSEKLSEEDRLAPLEAIEVPEGGWTREIVEERLVEAIRIAQRSTGRVGPRGFGSGMPAYMHTAGELFAQQVMQDEEDALKDVLDRNRGRMPPSTAQVSLAEQALRWPIEYVADEGERKAIGLWLLAKAVRRPWKALAKRRGINERTAGRRRDRAIGRIVIGLTKAGIEARGAGR